MITRRGALAASVAVVGLGVGRAIADPRPPSIAEFLRKPTVRGAAMSPDGKRIAVFGETWVSEKRNAHIDLIQADDPGLLRTRVPVGDHDIEAGSWANNERLLLRTVRKLSDIERKKTNWGELADRVRVRRLLSITAEGRQPASMFAGDVNLHRINHNLSSIVSTLPDDPQHILMRAAEAGRINLYRVNVETGVAELVERGGPLTNTWDVQNGRAVLRWDFFTGGDHGTLLSRMEGETEWKTVRKIRRAEMQKPEFAIVGDTDEPGTFLATVRGDGDPAVAIRKWDARTGELGEVVASRPGLDVDGALLDQDGKFVAARFTEDRTAYDFADKTLAAHFRGIESFFKRECNVEITDMSRDRTRFLMQVSGPRLPGAHYYYDLNARHLENLGQAKPWLAEERLARVEMLDVKVRDGGTIRAYLTTPSTSGPRPLVVMPHGGPELRDWFRYDIYAQIFAAQGWMVLQPNFRGSGGYGRAFAEAGHRRWGDRMQEDLDDAIGQVLATGRVDRQRVAIWGASYGGYAALMGAVRNPNLYRCAVSLAGPADLVRFMDDRRPAGDTDNPYYQYWVTLLGDPKTDAADLRKISPALRANEIQAPVLLIHGRDDGNVLPNQSRIMADALKSAGKAYEHVEVRGVGHSDWEDEDEQLLIEKSVAFIAKAFA